MAKTNGTGICSRLDDGGCGLVATVEDGHLKAVKGDPGCTLSRGFVCKRARALPELLGHPDRLTYPRVRVGERGAGSWERVSWDKALDIIADRLKGIVKEHGARSICLASGSPKGLEVMFLNRLASVLGTPNVSTPGNICHMPHDLGEIYTYGGPSYPDQENMPGLVVVWGINPLATNAGGPGVAAWLRRMLAGGVKLAVIDPYQTELAKRADLWLRVRPGADGALALGCLKVAVEEGLHDRDFVAKFTTGWEELVRYLEGFSLEKISRATWLRVRDIRQLARLYMMSKGAVILEGNALEHNPFSFQTARALAILKAVSGNITRRGGELIPPLPEAMRPGEFLLGKRRGDAQKSMLGAEHRLAHKNFFAPRHLIAEAVLEGKPYPLKALMLFGANPLLSFPDAQRVYRALKQVDFLVATDLFMTPSAALADVVLPAATAFEFNELGGYATRSGALVARPKVVEPPGECWPDIKIINEIGKRLGYAEDFWRDVEGALEDILKPAGLDFAGLAEKGALRGDPKSVRDGVFQTPSGKVELYSRQLEEMGYAPLLPFAAPAYRRGYPLVLSNRKSPYFFHSAYRQVKSLRNLAPEPRVEVHTVTAVRLGIREGDWAYIETPQGRIKQRVKFNNALDPRVVFADFGWWFPERGGETLYGWEESNLNVLTGTSPAEPAVGSTWLRGFPCRLKKS